MVKFNYENSSINDRMIYEFDAQVNEIHDRLHDNSDDIKDFRGWINLPKNYDKKEFERIKKAAQKIQNDSDILIVIGIGGSYLGARAVIEALTNCFYNQMSSEKRKTPQILYAGNNLSPNYLNDLLDLISEKDVSINVISKSGTTTEPAIAFRILREALETKYGAEEAKKRIYVTTDKSRGALKTLSLDEKYE
ncbi:glucose-6-phosphate isomerase, partial [bacterium]|nr:glucose-6-phosphate isomerase [bacterium]